MDDQEVDRNEQCHAMDRLYEDLEVIASHLQPRDRLGGVYGQVRYNLPKRLQVDLLIELLLLDQLF